MSAGNDNLLSRWSRRKQAARSGEFGAQDEDRREADMPAAEQIGADSIHRQPAVGEPEAMAAEAEEPDEPLPRLEDLTAESDLSAFLRKGVPRALKSAAMRRMWSLDPGIRDHVGLAEYAWDFNKPGSMAGFGPLDPEEAVVGFLSTAGRMIDSAAEARTASADALPAPEPVAPAESQAGAPSDGSEEAVSADASDTARPATDVQPPAPGGVEMAASQPEPAEPTRAPRPAARPRHGGAIPR